MTVAIADNNKKKRSPKKEELLLLLLLLYYVRIYGSPLRAPKHIYVGLVGGKREA
jgi:hypothetical protein